MVPDHLAGMISRFRTCYFNLGLDPLSPRGYVGPFVPFVEEGPVIVQSEYRQTDILHPVDLEMTLS